MPSVHSSIPQYYSQKPSVYDYENKPYYKGDQTKQEKAQEDREYPRLLNNGLSQKHQRFVQERSGEWHSDLERYANMEPISWNDMARFAQQPHGSFYPQDPYAPQSMAQHQMRPMSAAQ